MLKFESLNTVFNLQVTKNHIVMRPCTQRSFASAEFVNDEYSLTEVRQNYITKWQLELM